LPTDMDDIEYIVQRLRQLLRKEHIVKALMDDPAYRAKLYLALAIVGGYSLSDLDWRELSRRAYRLTS